MRDFCRFWRHIIKKDSNWSLKIGAVAFVIFLIALLSSNKVQAADEMNEESLKANPGSSTLKDKKDEQSLKKNETDTEEADILPEVSVTDAKVEEESGINLNLPITTITTEQLQRSQPSNIFEALRSVPGVSTTGGPRASGMTFSIRGYSDSEDVMVKVDGAPKGFEKYRMGGTFVEPELLKSIEVQRGPQITSSSGSLGGTIIAQTKNAADFLKPGQRVGGKTKFGYGNNNDEYSRSYMMYARPDEHIDILYNYSNRQSNNITLGDGSKLDSSAIESISQLLKFSIFPTEDIVLSTSLVTFDDSGLQPYDATGGQPGTFGNVIRSIDDFSWTQSLTYIPESPWINFKAVVSGGHTKLHDLIKPGDPSVNQICTSPPCTGDWNDYYNFKTKNVDLSNTAILFKTSSAQISLLTGYQYNESERMIERFFELIPSSGFNPAAPPGSKSYNAYYLQPHFQLGQVSIKPGYRRDDYKVEADGGTLARLNTFRQDSKIEFIEETWSLGLAYDFFKNNNQQQLTLYSNYGQGFRPPLIDEYFTQGQFSRCRVAGVAIPGSTMRSGPLSGICGDLYQPQTSESTEAGISYQNTHLMGTDIGLTSKLNFYNIYTSHLLSSLRENTDRSITQEGWERRNGIEFEGFLQYHGWFIRGAYSKITGNLFDGGRFVPIYTIPGNTFNINAGAELSKTVDFNITYRKVSDRNVILSGGLPNPYVFGIQDGYEIWSAGIHWQAAPQIGMRLIGENLTNKEYNLDAAMGGLGLAAPGRNVKFFVELIY